MATNYSACQHCAGFGLLSCNACYCRQCGGSGTTRCSQCAGRFTCSMCNGTRKIQVKKTRLFFSYIIEEDCKACSKVCPSCKGSQRLKCTECDGLKYMTTCPQCAGTRQLTCPECKGSGQVESDLPSAPKSARDLRQDLWQDWKQSLASMSKDDLRFEHEKYRSIRANLEIKLSRLDNSYNRTYDNYQHAMEQARRERYLDSFNYQAYKSDLDTWQAQIADCQAEIKSVEDALRLLEDNLWRRSDTDSPVSSMGS
jgi:hypothetical protein